MCVYMPNATINSLCRLIRKLDARLAALEAEAANNNHHAQGDLMDVDEPDAGTLASQPMDWEPWSPIQPGQECHDTPCESLMRLSPSSQQTQSHGGTNQNQPSTAPSPLTHTSVSVNDASLTAIRSILSASSTFGSLQVTDIKLAGNTVSLLSPTLKIDLEILPNSSH